MTQQTAATHTPGPWTATMLSHGRMTSPIMAQNDIYVGQAELHTNKDGLANARLIAAAPALLEALTEALADAETMNEPYRNEAVCERMRTAIALATPDKDGTP